MAACSGFAGAAALRVAVATACPGPQALSSRQPRLGFLIVRGVSQSLPAPRLLFVAFLPRRCGKRTPANGA
jgi:hypothetical protein